MFFGGKPPNPLGPLRGLWVLWFLAKYINEPEQSVLLGARPQTPWVGFAEGWARYGLLRSRTNAFCFDIENH
jgi:hypothetical protein